MVSWANAARVVRSLVIGLRKANYIKAAQVAGTNTFHMVTRHILPNIGSAIGTIMVTDVGATILRFAGLSFIGLGAQAPQPEWGMMINEARLHMAKMPSLILYPVIAVTLSVLAFQLISDGLQEKHDGKLH